MADSRLPGRSRARLHWPLSISGPRRAVAGAKQQRKEESVTGSAVPRPSQGQDDLLGKPPVHPATSEAGRLLCAGVHLHDGYRNAVIDQLYVQEQCVVAPSTGFDAARVLA